MSYELLFLVAVVVLLPLIQIVVRAARQRDHRRSEDADALPFANQPAKRGPAIDAPAVPPFPATAGDSAPQAIIARESTAPRDAAGPRPVPTGRQGGRDQMAAVSNLGDRAGLRRAMVLTAILGPCRAHDPHDRSESGPP